MLCGQPAIERQGQVSLSAVLKLLVLNGIVNWTHQCETNFLSPLSDAQIDEVVLKETFNSLFKSLPSFIERYPDIVDTVKSVYFPAKADRAFAFVEFVDDVLTTTAIAMSGFEYLGCKTFKASLHFFPRFLTDDDHEIMSLCWSDRGFSDGQSEWDDLRTTSCHPMVRFLP